MSKMNTTPKETLEDGKSLGDIGAALNGPQHPAKLQYTDKLRSEFIFDVLDGCAFNCKGCYIPRRNSCTPDDIETAICLSDTLQEMNIACEEMFIGPTDIFTANNFYDIMENPRMYDLTSRFSLSASSTLMSDREDMRSKWILLQKHLDAAPARDFVLIVAFDLQKYLDKDRVYLDTLRENLKFFKKDTVVFAINYYENVLSSTRLITVADDIHEEFNVAIRIIPSFFRQKSTMVIEQKSRSFIDMLMFQLIGQDLPEYLSFNMFDKYFGGEGFVNLSYKDGECYITPFLFDGIPQNNDIFRIEKPLTSKNITDKLSELTTAQYAYATQTAGCHRCPLLSSCIGRKVLAYMESRDVMECVVPKALIWDDNTYI